MTLDHLYSHETKTYRKFSRQNNSITAENSLMPLFIFLSILKKDFIYLFLDRREGREKGKERNINVWLHLVCSLLGTQPTTQACALTRNRTGDPFLCRPALNPLSHSSQGPNAPFLKQQLTNFYHCALLLPVLDLNINGIIQYYFVSGFLHST